MFDKLVQQQKKLNAGIIYIMSENISECNLHDRVPHSRDGKVPPRQAASLPFCESAIGCTSYMEQKVSSMS